MTPLDQATASQQLGPISSSLNWALSAAYRRMSERHDPDDGDTNSLRGLHLHTLICDRMDRAFASSKYRLPPGETSTRDFSDIYYALNDFEISTMPQVDPGLVHRRDINGSPCWHYDDFHLLLQSTGTPLKEIKWSSGSKTKLGIARKPYAGPQGGQLCLDINMPGLNLPSTSLDLPEGHYLIVAYRASETGIEIGYGLPRDNSQGGLPWHWFQSVNGHHEVQATSTTGTEASPIQMNENVTLKLKQGAEKVPQNEELK